MRPPPSVARIPSFPVVAMISLAAIFVTLAVKTGRTDIEPFTMSSLAFESEPWRLVACALPHGDALHIIFNVYWLWVLGTRLEEELGHVTTLVIFIVLAAGSAAAQYAFSVSGIGLSGIGYGIVGFLAVARRRDPRFFDAIDMRTIQLFAIWFVLCVGLTITGTWHIGNYAHGAGFLLGIPIAFAIAPSSSSRRIGGLVATTILLAAFVSAAALWRDKLNLSSDAGIEDETVALAELDRKEYDAATRHLEHALVLSPTNARIWFNYGVALQHATSHRGHTVLSAWQRALELDPTDERARDGVAGYLAYQGYQANLTGDEATAETLYRQSLATKENAHVLWNLSLVLEQENKLDEAAKLAAHAKQLDPSVGTATSPTAP